MNAGSVALGESHEKKLISFFFRRQLCGVAETLAETVTRNNKTCISWTTFLAHMGNHNAEKN